MLAEQHDKWTEMRRHIGLEVLAKSRVRLLGDAPANPDTNQEVTLPAITA